MSHKTFIINESKDIKYNACGLLSAEGSGTI